MIKVKDIYDLLSTNSLIKKDNNFLDYDSEVLDLTYDSRLVSKGFLFFCKGNAFKKSYLDESIEKGAVCYIAEDDMGYPEKAMLVNDVRKAMIVVAAYFFDYPDTKLKVIGVTGTKGKTTTVKFLKSIFDTYLAKKGQKPAGIISSINTYDGLEDRSSQLTTPEAIDLYRLLYNAVQAGLEFMILELSSQALKYHRATTVELDLAAFINISLDHVSEIEHPSFEDYLESKMKIIDQSQEVIISLDMDYLDRIKEKTKDRDKNIKTFSISNYNADIYAKDIHHDHLETSFTVVQDGEEQEFTIKEPGDFNIENALCAIFIARRFGVDDKSIHEGLLSAVVEGRNIVFESDDEKIVVWITYAHNGLSFDKSYETIRQIYGDIKIISIFGAPGDKAQPRINDLSRIGGENSDYIFIVPDDPGSKPFVEIAQAMANIIDESGTKHETFAIRAEAIEKAFSMVKEEKTLLFLAGKGVDTTDLINGQYVTIEDDLTVAKRCMKKYNNRED